MTLGKLHKRSKYNKSGVSHGYVVVTEVTDSRVIGHHKPRVEGANPAHFNVKLHQTKDGKGMFNTGSGSGAQRWFFADVGKEPEENDFY